MNITILIVLIFSFIHPLNAQVTVIKQYPIIHAGQAANTNVPSNVNIPYSITNTNDIVIFKAVSEIILGPDLNGSADNEFLAGEYADGTTGYFHAYLVPPSSFAELKLALDASYFTTNENFLRFKYDEKYADGGNLNFQIYDYQRNPMVTTTILPVQNIGASFFEIDIKAITLINQKNLDLDENKYYVLEVKNSKGDVYKLRFLYLPVR